MRDAQNSVLGYYSSFSTVHSKNTGESRYALGKRPYPEKEHSQLTRKLFGRETVAEENEFLRNVFTETGTLSVFTNWTKACCQTSSAQSDNYNYILLS